MRTKKFDRYIKNEMKEEIQKELKKMREDFMELQQQVADNKQNIDDHTQEIHNIITRHIPSFRISSSISFFMYLSNFFVYIYICSSFFIVLYVFFRFTITDFEVS
jgi:hypothetical protein